MRLPVGPDSPAVLLVAGRGRRVPAWQDPLAASLDCLTRVATWGLAARAGRDINTGRRGASIQVQIVAVAVVFGVMVLPEVYFNSYSLVLQWILTYVSLRGSAVASILRSILCRTRCATTGAWYPTVTCSVSVVPGLFPYSPQCLVLYNVIRRSTEICVKVDFRS